MTQRKAREAITVKASQSLMAREHNGFVDDCPQAKKSQPINRISADSNRQNSIHIVVYFHKVGGLTGDIFTEQKRKIS